MGLFDRFSTIFKANVNSMIDKAEDPEKMLDQLIRDMQQQYTEAKKQVTVAIADEKKLERLYNEQLQLQEDWAKKAELAVTNGNDQLAVQALQRKSEYTNLAQNYKEQLDGQKTATEKLKNSLRDLNNKIDEARRKKELLLAKAKRAKAQESLNKTYAEVNDQSAFDSFARMEDKVNSIEDKAIAMEELNDEVTGDTLEKEFEALEKGSAETAVMDELAALKAKLNKSNE
jgi:phage shock protein A